MTNHCFMLYGQAGLIFSSGIAVLANKIDKLHPITVHRGFTKDDWRNLVVRIDALPAADKVSIVANSLGASAATWIASGVEFGHQVYPGVKRNINYMALYDPTKSTVNSILKANAKRVLWFKSQWSLVPGTGQAMIYHEDPKRLTRIDVMAPHGTVDWLNHDMVVRGVEKYGMDK